MKVTMMQRVTTMKVTMEKRVMKMVKVVNFNLLLGDND